MGSTTATRVQLAVHDRRRIVEFHPEHWTDEHPAGRTLVENFLRRSGTAPIAGSAPGGAGCTSTGA